MRVTEAEIQAAKEIDLITYAESKGESFKQQGQYYRHDKHNSLVIKNDGKWFWNSRQIGGHDTISFAQKFYDMSFPDAVREINGMGIDKTIKRVAQVKKEFKYPFEYESKTQENIKNYLVNERALSPAVVDWLIRKDFIAEDRMKQVVFKWKERGGKGNLVGYERQGTVPMQDGRYMKHICAEGDQQNGFQIDVGKPNKLIMFESPIDMLSYWQIYSKRLDNVRLQSMSGLKVMTLMKAITSLEREGHSIEQVILAIDNDRGGRKFVKNLSDSYTFGKDTMLVHYPKGKDWNQDLQNQNKHKKEMEKNLASELSR